MLLISFSDLLILGHNTHMLRLIKSEAEIKLLRQSASLTAKAFKKVRRGGGGGGIRVVRNHFQRAEKRPGSRHSCLPITAKDCQQVSKYFVGSV